MICKTEKKTHQSMAGAFENKKYKVKSKLAIIAMFHLLPTEMSFL